MSEQGDRLIGRNLGRYRIESLIGKGGLAAVYKATDLMWDMPAAVKVLPEFFAGDEEHRQRFQREASTMANLIQPNIMPVRDYGQAEGVTFFAMDYAGGGTLEDRMGRPIPLEQGLAIIEPLAAAVSYAHGQGVIHRDLKPSNILFDAEGRMLIADFGIARLMEESGLTRTRESLGTPEYMAPEQSREASLVGKPADVYALGVILFQLVTGQVPYEGNTVIDVIEQHKYAPIPSARAINPRLPAALDEVFRRVLAKDPASRTQTPEELMDLLHRVAAGQPLPPDTRAAVEPLPAPASVVGPASGPQVVPAPRRGIPVWAWAIALAVALIAVAAFVLTRPKPESFYADAMRCQQRKDWSCCVANLERTLEISQDYRDAADRLAECRCRQVADNAWREIARCQAAEDWDCIYQQSAQLVNDLSCANDPAARKQFATAAYEVAQTQAESDPTTASATLQEMQAAGVSSEELPAGFDALGDTLDSYLQGTAAFAAGNYQEAADLLAPISNRWDARDYIYQSYVRLCQAALADGKLGEAESAANAALAAGGDGTEAQECLNAVQGQRAETLLTEGQALLDAGKLQEGLAAARHALEIQPGNSRAEESIAEANQRLAEEIDKQYQAKLQEAQALLELCHLPEAIATFDAALVIKPAAPEAVQGRQRAVDLGQSDQRRIADSYDDWSSQQGAGGWYYLARLGGTDNEIGWGDGMYWWDRKEGARIARDGQHPGRNVEAVRRWRSPVTGQIVIALQYKLADARGGTTLTIQQNRQGIWSKATSTSLQQPKIGPINVTAGTNLDFIVNSNGRPEADFTALRVTIFQQVPRCTRK